MSIQPQGMTCKSLSDLHDLHTLTACITERVSYSWHPVPQKAPCNRWQKQTTSRQLAGDGNPRRAPGIFRIQLLLPALLQALLLLHKGLYVIPGGHLLSLASCCLSAVLLFNASHNSIHLGPFPCKLLLQNQGYCLDVITPLIYCYCCCFS